MPGKDDETAVFEDDESGGISHKPTDFNQILMFQIGRINMIGSGENLVYDKIKASAYNNAVEELETLLEDYVRRDKKYEGELNKRKKDEEESIGKGGLESLRIVRLSRAKFRCLVGVMSRHNLFPGQRMTDEV